MDEQAIEIQSIQVEHRASIQKLSAVSLRSVIKEILIDMYARGNLPKEITQKLYNLLRLKEL